MIPPKSGLKLTKCVMFKCSQSKKVSIGCLWDGTYYEQLHGFVGDSVDPEHLLVACRKNSSLVGPLKKEFATKLFNTFLSRGGAAAIFKKGC
jgi:hypothetical protein